MKITRSEHVMNMLYTKIVLNVKKKNVHNNGCLSVTDFLTGKSFSVVLILASTNPQYYKRLSIDLLLQYMKIPSSEHGDNMSRIKISTQLIFRHKSV